MSCIWYWRKVAGANRCWAMSKLSKSNQLPFHCDETRKRFIASCPQKHMLEMERRRRNECETWCSWRDSPVLQQWQFLSQLGDIFTLKIEQTAAPKDFSQRKNICFDLSLTGRAGSWVQHYHTSWHIMQPPHPLPHVAPFTHRTQLSKPAVTYVTVPLEKSKTKLIQSFFKLSYGLCVSWDKPIGFRMNSAWCIKLHMYPHVSVEPSYSN